MGEEELTVLRVAMKAFDDGLQLLRGEVSVRRFGQAAVPAVLQGLVEGDPSIAGVLKIEGGLISVISVNFVHLAKTC